MDSPLEGIRVLEWASGINGPSTGCMLGDLGAEVIKIEERLRGESGRGAGAYYGTPMVLSNGLSVTMEVFNHSKKGIALDLAKEKAKEILCRLVEKSDVFLTNYRRSLTVKLGMDYQSLSKHNPQLIYATTSGLGSRGPESERRAFDWVGQAYSGMMTAMGERETPPTVMVGAPVDQAGAIMLAFGILTAIIARERTGYGQEVDSSMTGAAIYMQALNVGTALLVGRPLPRNSRLKSRSPLSNYYQCADGKWLLLVETQVQRFWEPFCHALGMPELVDDARFATHSARRENASSLLSILEKVFATKSVQDWLKILDQKVGLACSPVNGIADLANNPQVLENEYIVDFDHPVLGRIKLPSFPVRLSKTPASVKSKAPELGEHTEQVLMDICGYSWEEIAELKEQEVI